MISSQEFIKYTVNKNTGRLYDKRIFLHHAEELYEYINTYYPNKDIKEVAYILVNNIKETPKCHYCGKDLVFHDFINGYRSYCNKSCAAKDKDPEQIVLDKIIDKNTIYDIFVNAETGEIIPQRCTESYLKKNGFYNSIINYYEDSESCFETIYRIINDIDIRPVCKQCGKPVNFNYKFNDFCSRACSNKNEEVIEKISVGVSKTLKGAYQLNGTDIKNKRRITLKNKYNIDSDTPFSSNEVQDKIKNTIYKKYGVRNILQLEQNQKKSKNTNRYRSIKYRNGQGYDIEYIEIDGVTKVLIKNGCDIHGDILLDMSVFNNRTKEERRNYTTLCTECNPIRNPETSIETSIKKILNELNIDYIQHDRKYIKPYELDFYIPKYNIAIECNGIYWHSGEMNSKRLLYKKQLCESAGIRLLYFWEDEIHNKTEIIKGYLKSIFGDNKKIHARKCVIREISSTEAKQFIDNNHLQGYINSSIKIGLFYDNNLVQVMTFGKLRKCLGSNGGINEYELYRLCSLNGYTIVGGASKILNYFRKKYNPSRIITYCSNDISFGNVYEKIGFSFVKECGQGYCYINIHTSERKNRFSLRKNIVDDGSGRSETEINRQNGWMKCYDTGNKKYEIIYY